MVNKATFEEIKEQSEFYLAPISEILALPERRADGQKEST